MTPVTIYNERIEGLSVETIPDIITARALAPLDKLLSYAMPWAIKNPALILLFLKGGRAGEEIEAASKAYDFTLEKFPSVSDPSGCILKITDLTGRKKD